MVAMMPVSDPLSSLRCWLITVEGNRKLKNWHQYMQKGLGLTRMPFILYWQFACDRVREIDKSGNVQ